MVTKRTVTRKDVRSYLCKQLGRETADAILHKIDKLVKQRATASVIQKTIAADLAEHVQKVCRYHMLLKTIADPN